MGEVKNYIPQNANVYFDGGYKIGDQLWQMGPVFISFKHCLFIKIMCYLFELAHMHNLKTFKENDLRFHKKYLQILNHAVFETITSNSYNALHFLHTHGSINRILVSIVNVISLSFYFFFFYTYLFVINILCMIKDFS